MNRPCHSLKVLLLALILAFTQLHCLFVPDDERNDHSASNLPPIVKITGSSVLGENASRNTGTYLTANANPQADGSAPGIRFDWNAVDDDGTIVAYEWTLGDPQDESARQRTTESFVVVKFVEQNDAAPTLRAASLNRYNTIYVRAIDNDSGVSEWVRKPFNSTGIVPTAVITFPIQSSSVLNLNPSQLFRWEREDSGRRISNPEVSAWEYKLVSIPDRFDPDTIIRDFVLNSDNLLFASVDGEASPDWVRAPLERTSVQVSDLERGEDFAFAVRAIDVEGSPEPFLDRGRNMLAYEVRPEPGQVFITTSEPTLGAFRFPSSGNVWEVTVPTGRALNFRWAGDASHYGSLPGNSAYALDIPDPHDETQRDPEGMGGWIDWKLRSGLDSPISFGLEEGGTVHSLWVKLRDISHDEESERLCEIRITVVPFTFENFALIVDDAKFPTRPPDDETHDAFLKDTITRRFYELGDVDHLVLYPPSGVNDERSNPIDVDLETLARYQHIFWSVQVGTGNRQPLRRLEADERKLSAYSAAGGRLFFGGGRISSFLLGGMNGNFRYPKHPPVPGDSNPDYEQGTFIWDFMKYRGTIVSVPTDGSQSYREASGMIALRSQHPAYPDLHLDLQKHDPYEIVNEDRFVGGIKDWEGVLDGPEIAGMDPIYSPVTMDTTLCCGRRGAGFDDAIVAHRYESSAADTVNGTQQGRTVIFNFQPYWFEGDPLTDAGTAAINWLVNGRDH